MRESGAPVTEEEVNEFYTRGEKPVGGAAHLPRARSPHPQDPVMLTRITIEHCERARSHGVLYTELFWNWTGLKHFYGFEAGQAAIIEGLKIAEERFGIKGRLIPAIDREAPLRTPSNSWKK